VLHAFHKKSKTGIETPKQEIDLAKKRYEVPQPTISKIVNGNIEKLSIEFLIKLMVRAGLPDKCQGRRAALS